MKNRNIAKMGKQTIAAYVDDELVEQLRERVNSGTFRSFSHAIEELLKQALNKNQK